MFEIANSLVRQHGTCDPFRICSNLGIKVIQLPMTGIRGIYKRIQRNAIIFIDSNLPERESEFVCAHELGHHFLHKGENRVFLDRCTMLKTAPFEHEANLFAVCLIAPYPEDVVGDDETVDDVAAKVGVNKEVAKMYIKEYFKNKKTT